MRMKTQYICVTTKYMKKILVENPIYLSLTLLITTKYTKKNWVLF